MRRFIIASLFLVTMGYVATDLYLPSMPAIQKALNTTPSLVQFTIPLYMVSFAFAHIFFGPLSDRVGRRPVILFGLLFSLIGTTLAIFTVSIWMLIVARFLQGVGLGAPVAVIRPAVRDVSSGDEFAHIASIMATGAAAFMAGAPALGGYLQHFFGWRSPFIFLLGYTLLLIALTLIWIPETIKEKNPDVFRPKVFFGNYLHLLTSPIFLGYTLASSCALGGTLAYFTASPFILQKQMGLSPVAYGWTIIILAIGMGGGGLLNRLFLRHFGRHRSLLIGIALLSIGALFMLFASLLASHPLMVVIPAGFFAIGMSVTITNASAGAFTPFPNIAGFAGALFGCIFMLGAAISSSLMASFEDQSPLLVAYFFLGSAFLAGIWQWIAFLAVDKK